MWVWLWASFAFRSVQTTALLQQGFHILNIFLDLGPDADTGSKFISEQGSQKGSQAGCESIFRIKMKCCQPAAAAKLQSSSSWDMEEEWMVAELLGFVMRTIIRCALHPSRFLPGTEKFGLEGP